MDDLGFGFRVPNLLISPYARKGYVDHAEGEFSSPLKFISDNWGLPYLTERIERTHNFEHAFAFGKNPRTDAQPLPRFDGCYGDPFEYPGDDYPGWPEGTARPEPLRLAFIGFGNGTPVRNSKPAASPAGSRSGIEVPCTGCRDPTR